MDNNYNANYIPLFEKTFQYSNVQNCPICSKNNKPYIMSTTKDGNKHQNV